MSNIEKFQQLLESDSELAKRAIALASNDPAQTSAALAALSSELGVPVEAHEIEAFAAASSTAHENNLRGAGPSSHPGNNTEIDDAALEAVAGGAWRGSAANVMTSALSLGILCAGFAMASAIARGDVNKCQPDEARFEN